MFSIAQAVEHWSCKLQVLGLIRGGDWHFFGFARTGSLSSFEKKNGRLFVIPWTVHVRQI